jgi:tetratricopeptide (TPR) repeat protein
MAAIVRKEPRSMLARRASAFVMLYTGNARESVEQMFVLAALPNYQAQSFDRCTLGDAYLLLGRPDNALIAYEDALKINSENLQAKSGELRSMALVGRVEEAMTECVEAYKKAKQPPVQRYYRQLYLSLAEARAQLYTPPSDSGQGTSATAGQYTQ